MSDYSSRSKLAGNSTQQTDYSHGTSKPLDSESGYIPELVATRAVERPGAVALVDRRCMLTYEQLNTHSERLAYYLRSLGAHSDVVVGLCLRRSVAMAVGALAILKTGAAYLPIETEFPLARLTSQLEDAHVGVVLTDELISERLPRKWRVVTLDHEGRDIEFQTNCHGSKQPLPHIAADDLAYVIYTSGSTGQPKGVEITHRGLQNLVSWHRHAFGVTSADRASQTASPSFDAAVWELWPYLASGASLHFADDVTRSNPEFFRDWLIREGITIAFAPTPLAERLIDLDWPASSSMRVLLTGADTLHGYPRPNLPFTLINNYGPTECTVVATSGVVKPTPTNGHDSLPSIGRPIVGTEIYVLDEQMHQVADGQSGEIYVGGAGLARGYRNRPDLTAEKFISNPFSSVPGSRLYKTGDLGRFLPGGDIAFLGRTDEQIKLRGYRIEPGEIVSVLDRHPMVQASTVLVHEDKAGNRRLIGYVVPTPGTQPTPKILSDFLAGVLPDYMIPGVFLRLDSLPLSHSGKVDRRTLPEPNQANMLREENYVAPQTGVQNRIRAILATLLKVEKLGLNDNFFMLGGDSLLGAQLIARLRDAFHVEPSLLSLFDNPTIAELSAEVERLLLAKVRALTEEEATGLMQSGPQ